MVRQFLALKIFNGSRPVKMSSYFVHVATRGSGRVPALPEDVRRTIWAHTYPRPVVWCSVCTTEVVHRHADGTHVYVNTHPAMWEDTPRCAWCFGYAPLVTL